MASPQAEAVKRALGERRNNAAAPPRTVSESRVLSERVGDATAPPTGVRFDEVDADGVPAQWVTPEGADPNCAILYFHGGGYAFCSMRSHSKLVGHLAKAAGSRALNVDYRLAPEHPHPAALTDARTACRWLHEQGIAPEHIAVAGDSAGGGLAMALLVKLRDEGAALPAAGALMSPWVDLTCSGDSMTTRAALDVISDHAGAVHCATQFLAGQDPKEPYASPLYADLTGLPPLYVHVGDHEVFFDDAIRLADKARAAGVEVQLDVFPEMWHAFQSYAGNVPEADDAIGRFGAYLRARCAVDL